MTESASETLEPRHHTVRWLGPDWKRLEEAAKRLAEQTHIEITPTDIIRSATLKRVDEVLNAAA